MDPPTAIEPPDHAAGPGPNKSNAMSATAINGGIDLDLSHMLINQVGEAAIRSQIIPSKASEWQKIKGFKPIFLRLQPVDIPELMGIN